MCRDYYYEHHQEKAAEDPKDFTPIEVEDGGRIDLVGQRVGNEMIELLNLITNEYNEFQDLCDAAGAPEKILYVHPMIAVGIMMEKMKNLYLKSQEIIDLM